MAFYPSALNKYKDGLERKYVNRPQWQDFIL